MRDEIHKSCFEETCILGAVWRVVLRLEFVPVQPQLSHPPPPPPHTHTHTTLILLVLRSFIFKTVLIKLQIPPHVYLNRYLLPPHVFPRTYLPIPIYFTPSPNPPYLPTCSLHILPQPTLTSPQPTPYEPRTHLSTSDVAHTYAPTYNLTYPNPPNPKHAYPPTYWPPVLHPTTLPHPKV